MRQEGMQQCLDRRVGGGGVHQIGALQRHHVLVAESIKVARLEQGLELDGGQALRFDDRHVPAAALDA